MKSLSHAQVSIWQRLPLSLRSGAVHTVIRAGCTSDRAHAAQVFTQGRSVVVPVAVVGRVTMPVVDIIHMVLVRNGDVSAVLPVLVLMSLMDGMLSFSALVHVVLMHTMDVTVVHIVDMVLMR